MHLVTDVAFFCQYLIHEPKYKRVEHLDQLVIRDTLYRDYHRINQWILEKFPEVDISSIPDNAKITRNDDMEILSKDAIKKLICYCSNIDLEDIYNLAIHCDDPQM